MTDAPEPIEPTDLEPLLASGDAVLVDVREPKAFADGHPAGAINVPIGQLAGRLDELEGRGMVVTSCGGGSRGPKAAAQLVELGVDARVLRGGLRGWNAAGLDVDSGA